MALKYGGDGQFREDAVPPRFALFRTATLFFIA
jgi:hypothetical protein